MQVIDNDLKTLVKQCQEVARISQENRDSIAQRFAAKHNGQRQPIYGSAAVYMTYLNNDTLKRSLKALDSATNHSAKVYFQTTDNSFAFHLKEINCTGGLITHQIVNKLPTVLTTLKVEELLSGWYYVIEKSEEVGSY